LTWTGQSSYKLLPADFRRWANGDPTGSLSRCTGDSADRPAPVPSPAYLTPSNSGEQDARRRPSSQERLMLKKRHPSAGARPGTLMIPPDAVTPKIQVIQYSPQHVDTRTVNDVDEIRDCLDGETITWIDVQGLGSATVLQDLSRLFQLHPLATEDIVNVPQRPKAEMYGDQQLIIARTAYEANDTVVKLEQVSIVIGSNYVLTFQERYSDLLEPVRRRACTAHSRIRNGGSDYLAYAILDTVVDALYPVLERVGEQLEHMETAVLDHPHPNHLRQLNALRGVLVALRRAVWPKRELLQALMRDDNDLFSEHVRLFLRDTYDHVVQLADALELSRDTVTSLFNTYLSSIGHRTNEVMKVLTIMSAVFVPLTFMAGIYGMNFENMPELSFRWAYPLLLSAMLGTAGAMLWFFRRRGWLGGQGATVDVEAVRAMADQDGAQVLVLDPRMDTRSKLRRSDTRSPQLRRVG
jgi:magnesium transporter